MFACIDIGGSSVKVAVSDVNGELTGSDILYVSHEINEFTEKIVNWVKKVQNEYDITGIAISAPGAVDTKTGIIGGCSAVPCVHGPNWKEIFKSQTGLNVSIENDANCAALAEASFGSGKDYNDIAFIVCGTGIGGAILKDNKIHHGKHLYGGEFGFMIMEEVDGVYRNFSETSSTSSMVRKAKKHYKSNDWDGVKIFAEAEKGNEVCRGIIDTFYMNLAKGIYNIQHIYDPEIILLGGAISGREDFSHSINEAMANLLKKLDSASLVPKIGVCTHKQNANLVGALAHHLSEYNI